MRQTLHVCLLAGMLMVAFAKAAATPIAGVWEGRVEGRKAVTIDVRDAGQLRGTAVFYIIRDNGDGSHNSDAQPPVELLNPRWDGTALQFFVAAGEQRVAFVMKLTGEGKAELRRLPENGRPELVIPMAAIR